jgi:hypothetical protein
MQCCICESGCSKCMTNLRNEFVVRVNSHRGVIPSVAVFQAERGISRVVDDEF